MCLQRGWGEHREPLPVPIFYPNHCRDAEKTSEAQHTKNGCDGSMLSCWDQTGIEFLQRIAVVAGDGCCCVQPVQSFLFPVDVSRGVSDLHTVIYVAAPLVHHHHCFEGIAPPGPADWVHYLTPVQHIPTHVPLGPI